MKTQLIMFGTPIIVSDEKGTKGLNYNFGLKKIDNLPANYPENTSEWNYCRKIIAGIEGLPSIDWNGLEERFGWLNVEKLAEQQYGNIGIGLERANIWKDGFKKAQSLNEKKFTENDMVAAFIEGTNSGAQFESICGDHDSYSDMEEAHEIADSDMEDFIQSLKQPKIFDIEIEMEKSTGGISSYLGRGDFNGKVQPKIINNSIKILKKL